MVNKTGLTLSIFGGDECLLLLPRDGHVFPIDRHASHIGGNEIQLR